MASDEAISQPLVRQLKLRAQRTDQGLVTLTNELPASLSPDQKASIGKANTQLADQGDVSIYQREDGVVIAVVARHEPGKLNPVKYWIKNDKTDEYELQINTRDIAVANLSLERAQRLQ